MKRFFNFLVFVALLCIAVGSLQLWKERRAGSVGELTAWWHDVWRGRARAVLHPEKYTLADGPRIDLKDVNVLEAMSRQRVALAQAVVPSVVSIITSRSVEVPARQDDPFSPFFPRQQRPNGSSAQTQLGSGAIVSREGHIVTNNHVIEGMDEIEVKLSDGRTRAARLVGTDPDTDIAVLKIDGGNFVPLPFGNSEAVEVGETVMAVGNPYGLEESVTQGIISAKDRPGNDSGSQLLFQVDAALNPGNSGGPLINVRGELIGINEAIFSRTGRWQGVGFAIPSEAVRRTMDGILRTGRVIHGYLGIQRALTDGPGVVVDSVAAGSPAEKAAIRPGDTIRKFNGRTVNDFDDLRRSVAEAGVDTTVPVEVVRDGRALSVQARIAERPPGQALHLLPPGHPPLGPADVRSGVLAGVRVSELSPQVLRALDLPPGAHGVAVTRVDPEASAADKLAPGDIIEAVNQEAVAGLDGYAKKVRGLPAGEPVVVSIIRDRVRTMIVIAPH